MLMNVCEEGDVLRTGSCICAANACSKSLGRGYPFDTNCLTHKKTHLPRTQPQAYAQVSREVQGGWAFSHGRGTPVSLSLKVIQKIQKSVSLKYEIQKSMSLNTKVYET